jgi:transposase InsO family protein
MMSLQGGLTIERMCGLARVSRAGFYRWLTAEAPAEEEMEVRAAVHEVALEHRGRYGYRRVSKELRRRGLVVNHKRVARLMREDNLLAIQPRAWVRTTDSSHPLEVYLNLAVRMKLTGINQLWVADITYIRLRTEFVYLAVVLDAWSRKVVGWALGRSLAAPLTVAALQQAVAERQPPPGLVHHSDRGSQYACREYVGLLAAQSMLPSMSRPANPYDNANCESFMRTLKREEIHANTYRDMEDLRAHIEEFIERYYNRIRLHSALGYVPPEEFEQKAAQAGTADISGAASMSFFRHGEVYRWEKKSGDEPAEPNRFSSTGSAIDESPVGYSLAGCSPAEPASASPTIDYPQGEPTPGEDNHTKRQL